MWSMVNGTHLRSSGQWHCDGANGGKRSAYISHFMREIVCDLASNAYSQYVKLGIDERRAVSHNSEEMRSELVGGIDARELKEHFIAQ